VFLAQTVAIGAPGSEDADQSGVARLKPGISLGQANQDIARVLSTWTGGTAYRGKRSRSFVSNPTFIL
jgi:hypothetical protein